MTNQRSRARVLAHEALQAGTPTAWFETLYSEAQGDQHAISWADCTVNPTLASWIASTERPATAHNRALVVGCGLGDDAEALSQHGWDVCAFDISPTAVEWCTRRWPQTTVEYTTADLLALPSAWTERFDLVVEIYTLQVLPQEIRTRAYRALFAPLRSQGSLIAICRGRDQDDPTGAMPWPLTRAELVDSVPNGFEIRQWRDFMDGEEPPVRRFFMHVQRV